jgi:tRNA pseudouridine55 synthase
MCWTSSKKSARLNNKVIDSPSGLLLLDKPSGVTSFDCVWQVKRKLGAKRVGHCGTLDPAARGLLMILVGPATRTQDSFLALEKEYWFRGEFGRKTSTADLEGRQVDEKPHGHVTRENLEKVLATFVGNIEQTPPLYSALKFQGKPYYHYARKGLDVPRVPRPISIASLVLETFWPPYWEARVICSRGTYIRTLVEDIAERLGTCATLVELVRERVGSFKREQALSWRELCAITSENLWPLLRPVISEKVPAHV